MLIKLKKVTLSRLIKNRSKRQKLMKPKRMSSSKTIVEIKKVFLQERELSIILNDL